MIEKKDGKYYYSYDDIHDLVKKLSYEIISADVKINLIVGIATGGWIPARILRTYLPNSDNMPMPLYSIGLVNYDNADNLLSEARIVQKLPDGLDLSDKNVLVFDEVCDSGGTFLKAKEYLLSLKPKNLYTGVLHVKEQSEFQPDFIGKNAGNAWIVYPWDVK